MASSAYAVQSAANLRTAGNSVILAESGISTTGTTSIAGDIGMSPIKSSVNAESKEDIVARINLRTGLNVSLAENESLGAVLRVYLSNGRYANIRVLPAEASAKVQEELKAKCEAENCTIELKEISVNGQAKLVYEVKTEKKAKILGLISTTEKVQADIDAETGATVAVRRPWWSFMAREENT